MGQGFPFGPALLQRAWAISCLNILHYLSSHLLPLCCDTYLKYQSLWEPQWDIWKLRNAGFMCQHCVPSLCPFSLHSSMQVVLDEKGIKRGKKKKKVWVGHQWLTWLKQNKNWKLCRREQNEAEKESKHTNRTGEGRILKLITEMQKFLGDLGWKKLLCCLSCFQLIDQLRKKEPVKGLNSARRPFTMPAWLQFQS